MEKRERNLMLSFVTLIIVIAVICIAIYREESSVFQIDVSQYPVSETAEYCIDAVKAEGKMLYIRGWALKPGETIHKVELYVALLDEETNVYYQLPTEMEMREDVAKAKNRTMNSSCGFYSWSETSKIDYGNKTYRICILYKNDGNKMIVKTNEEI